jgi:hypothetical protein
MPWVTGQTSSGNGHRASRCTSAPFINNISIHEIGLSMQRGARAFLDWRAPWLLHLPGLEPEIRSDPGKAA